VTRWRAGLAEGSVIKPASASPASLDQGSPKANSQHHALVQGMREFLHGGKSRPDTGNGGD
jgi:hypothetical protein